MILSNEAIVFVCTVLYGIQLDWLMVTWQPLFWGQIIQTFWWKEHWCCWMNARTANFFDIIFYTNIIRRGLGQYGFKTSQFSLFVCRQTQRCCIWQPRNKSPTESDRHVGWSETVGYSDNMTAARLSKASSFNEPLLYIWASLLAK